MSVDPSSALDTDSDSSPDTEVIIKNKNRVEEELPFSEPEPEPSSDLSLGTQIMLDLCFIDPNTSASSCGTELIVDVIEESEPKKVSLRNVTLILTACPHLSLQPSCNHDGL